LAGQVGKNLPASRVVDRAAVVPASDARRVHSDEFWFANASLPAIEREFCSR
jgi:hypothetical protein